MAAAAAMAAWLPAPAPAPTGEATAERAQRLPVAERPFALPERETISRPAGELFAAPSQTASAPVAVRAVPAAPAAPPMPYRVAGQVVQDGALHIVLARGDVILTVREGDTLDDGYRVEAIRRDSVTLVYLPLNVRQDIATSATVMLEAQPSASSVAPPAARLRWVGPARVDPDATFDVALKLTSTEPVRAAPLQLTFDPDVLEPVAVRAGGFFSDGLFSYRVYPGGSIVIGATSNGAVPLDAEFVVVRFKPLRASATAELKVAAVSLAGPAGRAIAHEQPAAFRTVVGR